MGGLMSWESAKRELKKLYKNPEKELLSINNDSSSYILGYRCTDMSKQQKTTETKEIPFFPEGEKGVLLMARLSTNLRKEVHQKYITLGAVCASYPKASTESIIELLKENGFWED